MEIEHRFHPITPSEKSELSKIIIFLEKIQERLPNLDELKNKNKEEKLLFVENALRDTIELAREFYAIERSVQNLFRKITKSELSPLIKKIYQHPESIKYNNQGEVKEIYAAKITPRELRELEKEAENINSAQDPNYQVIWRHWWRDIQTPEIDITTPIKDPHINVTLKLAGKKKDIHLLMAA